MSINIIILLLLLLIYYSNSSTNTARYYSLLGIPKDADDNTIKKAYRKLAVKHHPDKNPENRQDAEKKFKEINEAYETLSDKQKRSVYDLYGEDAVKNPNMQPNRNNNPGGFEFNFDPGMSSGFSRGRRRGFDGMFMGGSMEDILNQLFGQSNFESDRNSGFGSFFGNPFDSNSYNEQESQKSSEKALVFTLDELYNGCRKLFKVRDYVIIDGFQIPIERICEVNVEAGWSEGTRLTYPPTRQFPKSVTFIIKEQKHPFFIRDSNNLIWKCKLSKKQVINGAIIKLPLLDKTIITLNTKDLDIVNGFKKIYKGLGMPTVKSRGGGRGDLIIIFDVQ